MFRHCCSTYGDVDPLRSLIFARSPPVTLSGIVIAPPRVPSDPSLRPALERPRRTILMSARPVARAFLVAVANVSCADALREAMRKEVA